MKKVLILALILPYFGPTIALPTMSVAPKECPIENGNLLDAVLFAQNLEECLDMCARNERCLFYHYYEGSTDSTAENAEQVENKPAQCFLYGACNRKVLPATEECSLTRENTVKIIGFVENQDECQGSCANDIDCVYYKYFSAEDSKKSKFCYHLKKCASRAIQRSECPLHKSNYIDHFLFVETITDCRQKCQDNAECKYWYWYPIDYSPAPLYCYLYRSCEGSSDEQTIGLVLGGRHPGFYFLNEDESVELVKGSSVCPKPFSSSEAGNLNLTAVSRAAAVSEFVDQNVLFCGGRNTDGDVMNDCMIYKTKSDSWDTHSQLLSAREESASAVVAGQMYIFGGLIDGKISSSTERLSGSEWTSGPDMPEGRSRFCAVALDDFSIAIIGGEIQSENGTVSVSNDMSTLNVDTKKWTGQSGMNIERKDHACVFVKIKDDQGVLVSGGVDEQDNLLDSVEFYNLQTQTWTELAPLKNARTEHGMAMIGGLVTVIGGVKDTEFLDSVEVFDHTSAKDNSPSGFEWRVTAHSLTDPRYDFALTTAPLSAFNPEDRVMDQCSVDQI